MPPRVGSSSAQATRIRPSALCFMQLGLILICLLYAVVAVWFVSSEVGSQARPKKEMSSLRQNAGSAKQSSIVEDHQQKAIAPLVPQSHKALDVKKENRVWDILQSAGVSESTLRQYESRLPTWAAIVQQYGEAPIIVGSARAATMSESTSSSLSLALQDTCRAYRQAIPAERRVLGAAGMFSTGTNLVTQLLKHNCYIPERLTMYGGNVANVTKEQLGMRWQVPWGKHTPAHYKWRHAATEKASAIGKNDVLPIITIRNPWRWMQSMCKNPYAAQWPHHNQCPNLQVSNRDASAAQGDNNLPSSTKWNPVTVKYGVGSETYTSLQHLWNDWYNGYMNVSTLSAAASDSSRSKNLDNHHQEEESYPWIMVRIEDLVFHTVETITTVCECAGGKIYAHQPFRYITESAKADSPGHDTSTGLAEAWIKYSQPMQAGAGFAPSDYAAALRAMDATLMNLFRYQNPPPPLSSL